MGNASIGNKDILVKSNVFQHYCIS